MKRECKSWIWNPLFGNRFVYQDVPKAHEAQSEAADEAGDTDPVEKVRNEGRKAIKNAEDSFNQLTERMKSDRDAKKEVDKTITEVVNDGGPPSKEYNEEFKVKVTQALDKVGWTNRPGIHYEHVVTKKEGGEMRVICDSVKREDGTTSWSVRFEG